MTRLLNGYPDHIILNTAVNKYTPHSSQKPKAISQVVKGKQHKCFVSRWDFNTEGWLRNSSRWEKKKGAFCLDTSWLCRWTTSWWRLQRRSVRDPSTGDHCPGCWRTSSVWHRKLSDAKLFLCFFLHLIPLHCAGFLIAEWFLWMIVLAFIHLSKGDFSRCFWLKNGWQMPLCVWGVTRESPW